MQGIAVVREVVDADYGVFINCREGSESFNYAVDVRESHMRARVGDSDIDVRAVKAQHIESEIVLFDELKNLVEEVSRVVGVEKRLAFAFDYVKQRLAARHMACGKRGHAVTAEYNSLKGFDHVYLDILRLADAGGGMGRTEDLKSRRAHIVGVATVAVVEIGWVKVVGMPVGYDQVFDAVALDTVGEKMMIGVGGEVDQQIVVYKRLRARADILSAESPCFFTVFAVAEQRGEALCRRRAEILELHFVAPLD